MRASGLALASAAFLIGSTAAVAQHPMVISKLEEINAQAPQPADREIRDEIAKTARAIGEARQQCVPTEVKLGAVAPVTGARMILQAALAGEIRNGWTAYATHEGCPGKEPVRYMLIRKADGSLIALNVNRGLSLANPSIMRDTSTGAALAALQKAKSLDPDCTGEKMEMGATRVSARSQDLGPDIFGVRYVGSWTEVWRFTTCGRSFDVPIEFRADGDGGAYTSVKAEEITVAG